MLISTMESAWLYTLLLTVPSLLMLSSHCVESRSMSKAHIATDSNSPNQFYVSVSGHDTNNGDVDHPFRTILRAQAAVRTLKKSHGGHIPAPGVAVNVGEGSYDFSEAPLQLSEEDSGEADARVEYRGTNALLSGGKVVPESLWQMFKTVESPLPVGHSTLSSCNGGGHIDEATPDIQLVEQGGIDYTSENENGDDLHSPGGNLPLIKHSCPPGNHGGHLDLSSAKGRATADLEDDPATDKHEATGANSILVEVMKVDLKKLGISDYGELHSGGLGQCTNNKLEVFYNGKPLVLARYPNVQSNGHPQFLNVKKVIDPHRSFTFSDARLAAVKSTSTLWLHGYWSYDWADNYVKVTELDNATSTVTMDPKTSPIDEFKDNARFYALNLLEFLDAPGEYFLDRDDGMLYFALPQGEVAENAELVVSMAPTVVSLSNVSFVTIEGLDIMYSRTVAVESAMTRNVTIMSSSISNSGGSAVSAVDATNTVLHNITASGLGCYGIKLSGGDLKSLTRGNSFLEYSTIHDFARWKRTYNPAVSFGGVGMSYVHNTIYDGPHSAILGSCNDCMFEFNTISNMTYESTDTGAFYTGRSWIHRGNVVRNNLFQHIRTTEKTALGYPSVQAIYLDDQMSGYEVYNNTFIDCQKGTFIGGGRRNHVYNNYYENCDTAVHLDERGVHSQYDRCHKNGSFYQEMLSVHYDQPPWSTHYPELLTIFSNHPCYPAFSSFKDNTYCKCKSFSDVSVQTATAWFASMSGNVEKCR